MRTKIWLMAVIIIIFGILIGGLVYFSQKMATQNKQISDFQNQITQLNTEKNDLQSLVLSLQNQLNNLKPVPPQTLTYTNDQYKFTLNFPATWSGYKVKQRDISWGGATGTSASFDFGFDAQDSIFNISILTHSQWSQLQTQEGPKPTYLGSNPNYVFAYDLSQYAANDTMAARRNEVSNIVSTFKLK